MALGSTPLGSVPLGGAPGQPLGPPVTPPADQLALRIGPQVNAIQYLRYQSWELDQELNGRDTAECVLIVSDGYRPKLGEDFILTKGPTRLFAGRVRDVEVEFVSEAGNSWTVIRVNAVDWNQIADRRLVAEVYENVLAGAILRDIVMKYLAADGITAEGVQDGPLVTKFVFPHVPASQCFREVSEKTGYHWNIDYFKVLHYFQKQTSLAPFAIVNGVNAVFRKFRERETLDQYVNVQYVDGGHGITLPQTERFPGDGATGTWHVQFPIFEAPTVSVNGAPATVGIRGLETGKEFYWNKNETGIGRDATLPKLVAGQELLVVYRGLYDLSVLIEEPARISERQSVEGGTGRYEHLLVEETLDGEDVVTERALGRLRRFGSLDKEVEFEIDQPGLAIGQQVPITVPETGLMNTLMQIMALQTQSLVLHDQRFTVRASSGELKGTMTEFWERVYAAGLPITLREGEVLQNILPLSDALTLADGPFTVSELTGVTGEFGVADVGESEWG